MVKDNTILYVGGIAVAGFLIYKFLGQSLQDTGSAIADTTSGVGQGLVLSAQDVEGLLRAASQSGSQVLRESSQTFSDVVRGGSQVITSAENTLKSAIIGLNAPTQNILDVFGNLTGVASDTSSFVRQQNSQALNTLNKMESASLSYAKGVLTGGVVAAQGAINTSQTIISTAATSINSVSSLLSQTPYLVVSALSPKEKANTANKIAVSKNVPPVLDNVSKNPAPFLVNPSQLSQSSLGAALRRAGLNIV